MTFLTNLLEKLFGLSGKLQVVVLVLTHLTALIIGLIIGMAFAKPTIVINKDSNQNVPAENNDEVIWGGDKAQTGGEMPRSSRNYFEGEDSIYRTQLLQLMPPSPSI